MALPPIHGQLNYKPALETSTGGAQARAFKDRKKETSYDHTPDTTDPEAFESLQELKRERGLL